MIYKCFTIPHHFHGLFSLIIHLKIPWSFSHYSLANIPHFLSLSCFNILVGLNHKCSYIHFFAFSSPASIQLDMIGEKHIILLTNLIKFMTTTFNWTILPWSIHDLLSQLSHAFSTLFKHPHRSFLSVTGLASYFPEKMKESEEMHHKFPPPHPPIFLYLISATMDKTSPLSAKEIPGCYYPILLKKTLF